ncbi:MAG: molecular chaperone HtpG, partial [Rhodospirillaceae bacterium]|nr:molecular chaperone HtpG [Rhodospirillaceae bacterium]
MTDADVKSDQPSEEKRSFGAEVSRLLHLMVHSVYSEKEIFLRELVSNASDACDRLRYAALTDGELMSGDPDLKVVITPNKKAKTLTISDNGVGMNKDDLIENLGTIARSGTRAFFEGLSDDDPQDVSLIGQFGIGFYSAFMVADNVDVTSRKAGEDEAWQWSSDGMGEYTLSPS